MGAYLSEPVTEKVSKDEQSDQLSYGASSMQGWRVSQEDAHNCITDFDIDTSFFAVYDGHGGAEVATYCSMNFPDCLRSMSDYKKGNLGKALENAFLEFDASLTKPEVIVELKQIAGLPDSDEESVEDARMLHEEASLPLDEVLARYETSGIKKVAPHVSDYEKPKSPMLRGKKPVLSTDQNGLPGSSKGTKDTKESSESEPATVNGEVDVEEKDLSKEKGKSEVKPELDSKDSKKESEESKSDIKKSKSESKDSKSSSALPESKSNSKEPKTVSKKSKAESKTTKSDSADSKADETSEESSSKSEKDSAKNDLVQPGCSSEGGKKRNKKKGSFTVTAKSSSSDEEEDSDEDDEEYSTEHDSSAGASGSDDDDEEEEGENEEDSEDEEEDSEGSEDEDSEMCGMARTNSEEEPGADSGCTAVVAVLQGDQLYVANAGDSRCVVCRGGKAINMSFDHKPEDKIESERIIKAGGQVTQDGRVNGGLNLSRAIGDHAYKGNTDLPAQEQMITALPDIQTLVIDPKEDTFMILACDGIWNHMSSQEVVDFVSERLTDDRKLSSICEELFDHCLAPDTNGDGTGCDNMTAIVVNFHNLKKQGSKRQSDDLCDGQDESDSKKLKVDKLAE